MRWRRVAFWSGIGLLALIVLVVSWLLLADLGSFKPQIERWASEKTGREIRVDGNLQINLAAHSSVVAEDLYIGNADWADHPEMIAVGRLEVQLDLGSLLNGPIVVELIDIDDARIALQKPAEGDPNWVMIDRPADAEPKPATEKKGFLLKQLDIDNVELVFTAAERVRPVELTVNHLSQEHRDDDFLELSLDGTLNDRSIKLDGTIGTWNGLLDKKDVQFDLGARFNDFTVNASGHLDDLIRPGRPRINFTASAPDVNEVLELFEVEQAGKGNIELVGSLLPQDQGPLVLDIAGAVGRLDIEATGEFSNLHDLEDIDIKVLATGEDVRPILEALGIQQTRSSPFMVNVNASRHGTMFTVERADMVFGQAKFGLSARLPEFPRLDDGVIKLQVDGPDIERFRQVFNLPGAATGPFSLGFTVDVGDDGLELLSLDLQTSLAKLHADGKLGDAPNFYGTSLNFELSSESLYDIASAYGIKRLPDQPIEIQGSAEYGPDGIRSRDSLSVTMNNVAVEVDGLIKPVRGLFGSDLEFKVDGPSLADLIGAFAANRGVPVQPYSLDGQVQIRKDGYRFREVTGNVGTSDVEVDGLLVPRRRIIGSRFNLAARGATFTEIIEQLGEFDVTPGPYELIGSVLFEAEMIGFENVKLTRATGSVDVDFELGMPVSRRWANVDLRASGPNVRSLLKTVDNFEADDLPFLIDIEGTLRDTSWSLENLDVNVGLANLTGRGTLDLLGETSATQFDLNINVPNVSDLGSLQGRRMSAQGFTLNATVSGDDDEVRVENLQATLGSSDIDGSLRYRVGDVPVLDMLIESESIVVAPLLEAQEDYDPAPEFDDGRLIPDIQMPFDAMARMDANIEIAIGELKRDTLHIRDVVLRAEIQDGALQLTEAGFQAASGAITARGSLEPNGGDGKARFELVAREFALGLNEQNRDVAMTGDMDVNLEATGADLRSLAGTASGVFFVNIRGGRMANNRFLQALYGDLLDEIIGTINPFSETEEYTDFECVILPVEVGGGKVTSNPNSMVVTDKMQIVAKSEINLKNEKIDMNIRTTPKKGISISAGEIINPYIKVVGTLAKPKLAVDETGVLLSGGAAVATGGLSVLARAAWTRLSRAKDPCEQLTAKSKEELSARFPDLTVSIVGPSTPHQPEQVEQE